MLKLMAARAIKNNASNELVHSAASARDL